MKIKILVKFDFVWKLSSLIPYLSYSVKLRVLFGKSWEF